MEKIDKAIEILQAFKEGKTIEWKETDSSTWYKLSSSYTCDFIIDNLNEYDWRISKKPTYRPYKSAEEFLKASKEHGPYLKYKNVDVGVLPCQMDKHRIYLVSSGDHVSSVYSTYNYLPVEYEVLYDGFIWQDGTPCGIRE